LALAERERIISEVTEAILCGLSGFAEYIADGLPGTACVGVYALCAAGCSNSPVEVLLGEVEVVLGDSYRGHQAVALTVALCDSLSVRGVVPCIGNHVSSISGASSDA